MVIYLFGPVAQKIGRGDARKYWLTSANENVCQGKGVVLDRLRQVGKKKEQLMFKNLSSTKYSRELSMTLTEIAYGFFFIHPSIHLTYPYENDWNVPKTYSEGVMRM